MNDLAYRDVEKVHRAAAGGNGDKGAVFRPRHIFSGALKVERRREQRAAPSVKNVDLGADSNRDALF